MYDPTRLAALVAVAEAGSITRAAERLGYTPPTLSQQVAKLEREAGATLLVRSHRGTRLTDAGELLVVRARRVLDEMELARHELAGLAGLSGGTLRLGTFQTAGTHLLPPVLSAFRRAHPDVALAVADYEPPLGIAAVAAGEVDLALTHTYRPAAPVPVPSSVGVEPLLVEELVLVTAPGHLLADGTARLPLTELAGQPLISMAPHHPPRQGVEAALARAGATPAVLVETPVYALVCALVSAGLGVAVVPEMVAATAATPVSARLLEPGDLRRTISVAHRADVTVPAADAFRALLRGAFGRAGRHRLSGRPETQGRRDDIL
ncbi:LysR family transcriptional regulator [Streptomyces sp. LN245]|uniref:LysR family transcriptional regulator n=1 Tax=Streptomyces sp. LN245 TaxID=3112975 RepID=UPI00371D0935